MDILGYPAAGQEFTLRKARLNVLANSPPSIDNRRNNPSLDSSNVSAKSSQPPAYMKSPRISPNHRSGKGVPHGPLTKRRWLPKGTNRKRRLARSHRQTQTSRPKSFQTENRRSEILRRFSRVFPARHKTALWRISSAGRSFRTNPNCKSGKRFDLANSSR